MKKRNRVEGRTATAVLDGEELLSALIAGPAASAAPHKDLRRHRWRVSRHGGRRTYAAGGIPGQPGSAAIAARSVWTFHGAHIGKPVVLVFEGGDLGVPIVLGVVRAAEETWPLENQKPGQVGVRRTASVSRSPEEEELVLRCGEASITLTKAGKVLIHGHYVD